jgi:hypothetical protein
MNNQVPCVKCGKSIVSFNKMIHEAMCNGIMESNVYVAKPENINDEFWFCEKCNNYLAKNEKEDHMLCHQFEIESDEDNGVVVEPSVVPNRNPINNNVNSNQVRGTIDHNNLVNMGSHVIGGAFPSNRTVTQVIQHPNGGTTTITTMNSNSMDVDSDDDSEDEHYGMGYNRNNMGNMQNMPIAFPFFGNNLSSNNNNQFQEFINSHPIFRNMNLNSLEPTRNQFLHISNQMNEIMQQMNMPVRNPVNSDILSSLAEFTVKSDSKIFQEKKDCSVCLEIYEIDQNVNILPCTHMFHADCIKNWFKDQNTCPICKTVIDEQSINPN